MSRIVGVHTRTWMAWLGLGLLAVAFVWADPAGFPLPWAVLPVLGAALLIGGAQVQPQDAVRSKLAAKWLVWLAKVLFFIFVALACICINALDNRTGGIVAVYFSISINSSFGVCVLSIRRISLALSA